MKVFSHLWTLLAEKGKIATIIGMCFICPINAKVVFDFFIGSDYTKEKLTQVVVYNIIAYAWFIMISYAKAKFGTFELEVKD